MNLIGLKCSDTVYVTEAFYQCWDFSCVQPFAAKHRLPSWYLNPKRALNFKRLHLVTSAVQIRLNSRQKMFFPVKRTGGYQHVSLSLSLGDFIQMDSSDMLNLRAYIETAFYYQPGAHDTKTKMETCVLWPWKSGVDPCVATASLWRVFAEVWINYIFCLNVVPGVTISSGTNFTPVSCTGLIHWFS